MTNIHHWFKGVKCLLSRGAKLKCLKFELKVPNRKILSCVQVLNWNMLKFKYLNKIFWQI